MTLILAAVSFVGALLESQAPNTPVLVAGRLVLGAGVGIAPGAGR